MFGPHYNLADWFAKSSAVLVAAVAWVWDVDAWLKIVSLLTGLASLVYLTLRSYYAIKDDRRADRKEAREAESKKV